MKKAMIFTVCVILFINVLQAEERWNPHGYISSTLQERYIGLRVSSNFYNDWMHWTEAYIDLPDGFFLDVWNSRDIGDNEIASTSGDEIDLTIGWQKDLLGFNATLSVNQYICPPFKEAWGKSNASSQDLVLSKRFLIGKKHTITPSLWIGYISMNDEFEKGAFFTLPNIKHNWENPFNIDLLNFSQTIMLAWDDGFCNNSSDGLFLRWMPGLNWKISDCLTITAPGVIVLQPLTNTHDARGREASINFSATYKF